MKDGLSQKLINVCNMNIDPSASNKINKRFLVKYSNPKPLNLNQIKGYKLVRNRIENFYSIATGHFRYKTGPVDTINAAYHRLYENTPYFCEEMIGKVAVCRSQHDIKTLYNLSDADIVNNGYTIVKIFIGGNLIEIETESDYYMCNTYTGSHIIAINNVL